MATKADIVVLSSDSKRFYIFTVHRLYTTSLLFPTLISDFDCSVTGQEKQDIGNNKTGVQEPLKENKLVNVHCKKIKSCPLTSIEYEY